MYGTDEFSVNFANNHRSKRACEVHKKITAPTKECGYFFITLKLQG